MPPARPVAVSIVSETYLSLSVEARYFVDTICGMGFNQADVVQAVRELGIDDKQVFFVGRILWIFVIVMILFRGDNLSDSVLSSELGIDDKQFFFVGRILWIVVIVMILFRGDNLSDSVLSKVNKAAYRLSSNQRFIK